MKNKVISVNIINKKNRKEETRLMLKESEEFGVAQITAVRNEKIIGNLNITKHKQIIKGVNEPYYSISIHSNDRGRGIGSNLIEASKNYVRLMNKKNKENLPIVLEISPYNAKGRGEKLTKKQLQAFYEKHGFSKPKHSKMSEDAMMIRQKEIKVQHPRVIGGQGEFKQRRRGRK